MAGVRHGGSVTAVVGSPGIGKSALLDALATEGAELRVLRARGGELERDFPYGVMRQLFEPAVRNAAPGEDLLGGAAAPAGALLGGEVPAEMPDGVALDHALYWLAGNVAEAGPLLFIGDDLHWCDAVSARALLHLARRIGELPIALVLASRPVTHGMLLERLLGEAARRVEPAGLSDSGVRRLVAERWPAAEGGFCDACREATEGNPFLLSALLGAAAAQQLAPLAASAARVRTIGPRTVMSSVLLRLDTLGPAALAMARALSVLGDEARMDLVSDLSGIDQAGLVSVVDGLRRIEILAPDGLPRFRHAIVRAAVYEDIPAAERSRLHRGAAGLLAERGGTEDAIAAQLLATDPGADPWVVERLSAAGLRAFGLSAPETAVACVTRALAEGVTGPTRAQLLLLLGGARFQLGFGAVAPLREALALATEPAMQMEAARALAGALLTEQRYQEGWDLAAEWITRFATEPALALELELQLTQRISADIDPEAVATELERIAQWRPDPAGASLRDRSRLAFQAYVAMIRCAPPATYLPQARIALSGGRLVVEDTWLISFELAVSTLIGAGAHAEALDELETSVTELRRIGRLLRSGTILPIRSQLLRRLGRLAEAEEDARIAFELIPVGHIYEPHAVAALVAARTERGDLAGARAVLVERGFVTEIPRSGLSDVLWLARGELRIAEGDLAGGVDDVLVAGAICQAEQRGNPGLWPWRTVAAEALVRLGRQERALELAAGARDDARRGELDAAEAVALRALGLAREESVLLQESVDRLAGSDLELERAKSQLALGSSLRLTNQRALAREPLLHAVDLATRIGAATLAQRAGAELLATGARPRRTALRGPEALTPSERRVAELAAEGMTNRRLAQTLYVTPKTVEAHLRSIYAKLQIAGKADLAGALAGGVATKD